MAPSTKKTSKATISKPYDKPSSSKAKVPANLSNVGAPATHGQATRKGKKAWRKNIDIAGEEHALEAARAEERVTGGKASAKSNDQLFVIDTAGDAAVAKKARKEHPRRSLAILNVRSAVPALSSRTASSSAAPKVKVTAEDKRRLLRIARKGNVGSDGSGLGSAVISTGPAARGENLRDVWGEKEPVQMEVRKEWGAEGRPAPKPKAPITIQRQRALYLEQTKEKALPIPEEGTSYNPRLESHQALIDRAVEEEVERLRKEAIEAERLARLGGTVVRPDRVAGVAPGMTVADGEVGDGEEEEEDEEVEERKIKVQRRKTQQERNKARRNREAKQTAVLDSTRRKLAKSVSTLPVLSKSVASSLTAREVAVAARKALRLAKETKGLKGGEKVGKYRVKAADVEVQLGEDLSENLRGLKPEGNLFRDRFMSMQQRSLIEPRVPQMPKRRTHKIKEYEKHAWKRFE